MTVLAPPSPANVEANGDDPSAPNGDRVRATGGGSPPDAGTLGAASLVASVALVMLAFLLLGSVAGITVVSRFEHLASQHHLFEDFRGQLANGTAPASENNAKGQALATGTPLAILRIPAAGVDEVVTEGTSGANLESGPGHLRGSPLPGEHGTSQIFGRAHAFGGPFRRIPSLRTGAVIEVTTGVGRFNYRVIDVRRAGDPEPSPPAASGGRLTLVTAGGRPFEASGAVRVDADLNGRGEPDAQSAVGPGASERALATSTSTLWQLVGWLEVLLLLSIGAVLSWRRWGRAQTWIVFLTPTLLVGTFLGDQLARLLPNLT